MKVFVDRHKKMTIGKDSKLNVDDEVDGDLDATEKRAEFPVVGVVITDRPPPEPPPWNAGESRVWKHLFNFTVCLRFIFHDHTVYFSIDFFYYCKTFTLGVGDESYAVTVIGSIMPNLRSTSYIALSE
ncbi:unnamed protein product, partial [Cuscuta epithymum]